MAGCVVMHNVTYISLKAQASQMPVHSGSIFTVSLTGLRVTKEALSKGISTDGILFSLEEEIHSKILHTCEGALSTKAAAASAAGGRET